MTDPARTEQAYLLVYTSIAELLIDLPDNVWELDRGLAENRGFIDRLQVARSDLHAQLKGRAEARRTALRQGGHLTPATGTRANYIAPEGVTESYFMGQTVAGRRD